MGDLLLIINSSKNTLLIILLEVHGIPHSRNNSLVWSAQRVRTNCLYSNHRVWSFPVGLELFVPWVSHVFKNPSYD